jgi:hypothetical protein
MLQQLAIELILHCYSFVFTYIHVFSVIGVGVFGLFFARLLVLLGLPGKSCSQDMVHTPYVNNE